MSAVIPEMLSVAIVSHQSWTGVTTECIWISSYMKSPWSLLAANCNDYQYHAVICFYKYSFIHLSNKSDQPILAKDIRWEMEFQH